MSPLLQRVPLARDDKANDRTRRRLTNAIRRREALIEELAPDLRCAECGVVHEVEQLVVDHVDGVSWNRWAMSPQMRAAKYWREHRAGVALRALCNRCSCRDGNRRKHNQLKRWR